MAPNGRWKRRRARRLAHERKNGFLPRLSWTNRFDHLSDLHNQDDIALESVRAAYFYKLAFLKSPCVRIIRAG